MPVDRSTPVGRAYLDLQNQARRTGTTTVEEQAWSLLTALAVPGVVLVRVVRRRCSAAGPGRAGIAASTARRACPSPLGPRWT